MKSTFFSLRNLVNKAMILLLMTSFAISLSVQPTYGAAPPYTPETIEAGSIVIDMGQMPQTTENGLLPYGLVYALVRDLQVPVEWVINSSKTKDGIDFSGDGIGFKGAPFIIKAEYVSPAVVSLVSTWEAMGVVTHTLASPAIAPVFTTINFVPGWTLDDGNGGIAEGYISNAGIPESAYNWKDPQALDCCDDLFVMPHADPEWSTHSNLFDWNLTCNGGIWAACHAVSALELMFNPADPTQQTNFLSTKIGDALGGGPYSDPNNSLVKWGEHGEGDAPYDYFLPTAPPMQFLGNMDDAMQNGSEQSYMPVIGAEWRPTTQIGVSIPNHPDFPSLTLDPIKVVFGQAFGDSNRGKVMYEAGHSHDGGDPANIAAQRAFLNFSFWAARDNAISVDISGVLPTAEGASDVYNLSAAAAGGTGNFTYQWVSDCPGTFANPNAANTTFTPDFVSEGVACVIKCIVQDDCGTRTAFSSGATTIVPAPQPPVANDDDEFTNPEVPVTLSPLDNDTDLNLDIDPSTLTFWDSNTMMPIGNSFSTGNGTFTINFDGTVTYVSDPLFIGTETIDYQICDETLPADGGPFCDVATITIIVDQTDEFGCTPLETYSKLYTAYGFGASGNAGVGSPFFALGYPEGLSINKAAVLNANAVVADRGQITITLANTILQGDVVEIYGWAQDGNPAAFTVESSADGITFGNVENYTAPNKDQSYTFDYTIQDPDGAVFIRVKSNDSSKDFLLDGLSYDVKACKEDCVLPEVDLIFSGTADNFDPLSTAGNEDRALGLPNKTFAQLDDLQFLILDLTDIIPSGELIQLFLSYDSQSPEPSVKVTGSNDGTNFTNEVIYFPTQDKDESVGQYLYTVDPTTQSSGIRYLRFEGVTDQIFLDAVVYEISTCESSVPNAENDVTYTLEGVPTTYPVQINDSDPQNDALTTTQITSDPSNGTATINPDGTITYVPNADFNGVDVLTYEICDVNGLCDEATLTINIPDDGCADPGETLQNIGESFAIAATDPGNNVNNEADATYYPDGVNFAEMDNPTEELVLELSEIARAGTFLKFYANSDGAQVDFTVKVSEDGVPANAIDAVSYSVTGTAFTEFEYLINSPDIDFIHFINDDADDKLGIDGVLFEIWECAPTCTAPNTAVTGNGFATAAPAGDRDPINATGTPDLVVQEIRDGEANTVIDLGEVVPQDAYIYLYLAHNGTNENVNVRSNLTNGSFTNLEVIAVTNEQPDYQAYSFQVSPAAGIQFIEFESALNDRFFIDAVGFYYSVCEDATPTAVDDNAFTSEETPVTYPVQINDTDPADFALSTTQITSPPSNGSAVINPDGTITYTPDPEFTGTDQLTYEICNPLGACDTAILTIDVAADPCAANESPVIVGTGYGFSQTNVGVGNPDNVIGVPDDIYAALADDDDVLVVNLDNTVAPGDEICFEIIGEAGKTSTYDVSFSTNGTHPGSNTQSFSISGIAEQQICVTLNFAGGASYIHFENTSVGNENISIDGVTYNLRECAPTGCLLPEEALTQSGFAEAVDLINSTANTPIEAAGTPDNVGSQVASGEVLIVDLGQNYPEGTILFFYLAEDGGSTISATTSTTTSFSGSGTAFTVTSPVDNYQQHSLVVGTGGARYVRFNGTNGNINVDAVGYAVYFSNSLAGNVWDDSNNEDGVFDTGEAAFEDVTVNIYEDKDNDGTVSSGDELLTTVTTDANGFWSYNFFAPSLPLNVVMEVDESTLPSTPTNNYYTTAQYQTATLTSASDSDCDNDFGRAFDNPPVATDDTGTTEQNTTISINLIANDQNPDVDGETTTVTSIINAPSSGGSVSINPDGTAVYTPPVGFTGTEVFTYTLCDEADPGVLCDTATVTVTVTPFVNDPPVANNDTETTEQDEPISINVLINDSDPEGGNISPPACVGTDADAATPNTCDGMTANGGTVTILPSGEIYYEPPTGFVGVDQVTYVICDPLGLCDDAVIDITVVADQNDPPIAGDDSFNVFVPCGVTVLSVIDNDYDPDGSLDPASVTITTPLSPATGTLTNNNDGTFSYTATAAGTYTFDYQICDDGIPAPVECDIATVTITVPVTNTAPVANDDSDEISAGLTLTTPVLSNDSDPEGDDLTITLCTGLATGCGLTTTTTANGGTVTVQPSGKIEYVPTPGYTGVDTYFYEICDNGCPALCDQATVTVTFVNQAPLAIDDQDATAINTSIPIDVLDNDFDPEGDGISIQSAGIDPANPIGNGTLQGGSVSINNGGTPGDPTDDFIDYSPPTNFIGQDTFYYEICDDNAVEQKCDIAEVIVTITSPIDIEIVKTVFPTDPEAGDNVTYTLTISNTSIGTATGVIVKDQLPSGLQYVSDTGSGAYDESSGIWSVGSIAPGASKSIQIVATVNDFINAENVAEVTSHNEVDTDSTPNNNDVNEDDQSAVILQCTLKYSQIGVIKN